ncbi:unnamed protein product [Heligmosomoides polygyrus]|uniref:CUB domain-containing protein n=1 Tax=Heligmosomoides polygyrus TaxID=6339 RepID=A0A183FDG1_HELPZ|nr:unnamed protein product [Heligmosomoides polygyrus]
MTSLSGVLLLVFVASAVAAQNASFSGAQGIIYSPGYPDNYSNQLEQFYTITVEAGYYIHLTLYDFQTEACCDKLYIWDGDDTSSPTIANVSGYAAGMTFSSSGPVMTLLFSTDITGQDRGFAIQYEMVLADTAFAEPSTCQSGLRTSSIGFVTSPEWPSNYPDDILCSFLITMPKGRWIAVALLCRAMSDATGTEKFKFFLVVLQN